MTTYADASDIALWGWKGWAVVALALALALLILGIPALVFRDRVADAPLMEPEPDYGGCSDIRPHVMLPTSYGWRCANDCGESWYVEESDELATADLALWELENDWSVPHED